MPMPKLSKLSVETLLQLRADVEKMLATKANELKSQLAQLGGEITPSRRGRGSALKGRRVPIKYRDRAGNTWAGRGARPRWLVAAIKEGKKLEDFAVEKTVASRKASPSKKRRAKR
ncbi:MAG TPA: H-NS histone family protein [Candidatus Binatia bacterium]|jgi:DNA-binding protein H-NS